MPGPPPKYKTKSRVISVRVPACDYDALKVLIEALVAKHTREYFK